MKDVTCRFCGKPLKQTVVDLGLQPLSNSFLSPEAEADSEPTFPLVAYACDHCNLVQVADFVRPASIFDGNYAYYSSYSSSWLQHVQQYAKQAKERFELAGDSLVVELASNDGYLLQYFKALGVPVLGVDPAENCAKDAIARGIPTRVEFFGQACATRMLDEGLAADLIVANNVLAHVPDINDFVRGIRTLLKPNGEVTVEFPHLLEMIEGNAFDTIYQEHYSYLSLGVVRKIFAVHGLTVYDAERLPTHGGSLRIFATPDERDVEPTHRLLEVQRLEETHHLTDPETYRSFAGRVREIRDELLTFLTAARNDGKRVVGYGAPAKGNTLLNYCGVGPDLLAYTVDRSPHKQGKLLPGSHIPIYDPLKIDEDQPDYVLILPWNLGGEITKQLAHIHEWGGRFVTAIPELREWSPVKKDVSAA